MSKDDFFLRKEDRPVWEMADKIPSLKGNHLPVGPGWRGSCNAKPGTSLAAHHKSSPTWSKKMKLQTEPRLTRHELQGGKPGQCVPWSTLNLASSATAIRWRSWRDSASLPLDKKMSARLRGVAEVRRGARGGDRGEMKQVGGNTEASVRPRAATIPALRHAPPHMHSGLFGKFDSVGNCCGRMQQRGGHRAAHDRTGRSAAPQVDRVQRLVSRVAPPRAIDLS